MRATLPSIEKARVIAKECDVSPKSGYLEDGAGAISTENPILKSGSGKTLPTFSTFSHLEVFETACCSTESYSSCNPQMNKDTIHKSANYYGADGCASREISVVAGLSGHGCLKIAGRCARRRRGNSCRPTGRCRPNFPTFTQRESQGRVRPWCFFRLGRSRRRRVRPRQDKAVHRAADGHRDAFGHASGIFTSAATKGGDV